MRTSQEIREELASIVQEYGAKDSTTDIITGWIEALEWVLSDYEENE